MWLRGAKLHRPWTGQLPPLFLGLLDASANEAGVRE